MFTHKPQHRNPTFPVLALLCFVASGCGEAKQCGDTATCTMTSDAGAAPHAATMNPKTEMPPTRDSDDSSTAENTDDDGPDDGRSLPLADLDPEQTTAAGEACAVDDECGDGYCVDGVCCESMCNAASERCDLPGTEGRCTQVSDESAGPSTPHDAGTENEVVDAGPLEESDDSEEPEPEPEPEPEDDEAVTADAGGADGGADDTEDPECSPNDDECGDSEPACEGDDCPCDEGETRSCVVGGLLGSCASGLQSCDADGEWSDCSILPQTYDSCALGNDDNCDGVPNAPLDPACACVEGDTGCSLGTPSTEQALCTSAGSWEAAGSCPFVCEGDGVCGGVCSPGVRECNGTAPRECGDDGQWRDEPACGAATPCQSDGRCEPCPDGSYALGGACVPWSDCLPGQYVVADGTPTSDRQCSACGQGSFSATTNASSCETWSTCDAGESVSVAPSATEDRQCSACEAGSFSTTTNAPSCTQCKAGTFTEDASSTSCKAWASCTAGEYVAVPGAPQNDRECEACSAGSFSAGDNVDACTPFTECVPGYVEATPGGATFDRTCKSILSCGGMLPACGDGNDESCCTTLFVPGGSFDQRSDSRYPTTVSDFRLDKFEVTVGRFAKFAAAWDNGYRPAQGDGKHTHVHGGNGLVNAEGSTTYEPGWSTAWTGEVDTSEDARHVDREYSTWTTSSGSASRRPINYVNWYEAYAFCIWDGGFLPTAAELNYAATGGSEQRFYPWSVPATSTDLTSSHASYACQGDGSSDCTIDDLMRVGAKPNGNARWGHADLAGNVREWMLDAWPSVAACANCATLPADMGTRFLQAGAFRDNDTSYLETASRYTKGAVSRTQDEGFRCARTP